MPSGQLTQLGDRVTQLVLGIGEDCGGVGGRGRTELTDGLQGQADGEQPLLGSVVQVAFEAATSLVGRLDQAYP